MHLVDYTLFSPSTSPTVGIYSGLKFSYYPVCIFLGFESCKLAKSVAWFDIHGKGCAFVIYPVCVCVYVSVDKIT